MIKNEILNIIFKCKVNLENLYADEHACLLFFRLLPKLSQEIIMQIINIDERLNWTEQQFEERIFQLKEDDSKTIKKKLLMLLYSIKILTKQNFVKLNSNFKQNIKKIIKDGISIKSEFIEKKKRKPWNKCYEKGIAALEKYLTKIKSFDAYSQQDLIQHKENLKFFDFSGFFIKLPFALRDSEGNLSSFALKFLLEDTQTQLRTLMLKLILIEIRDKNDREKEEFLFDLFKLCTLETGIVIIKIFF